MSFSEVVHAELLASNPLAARQYAGRCRGACAKSGAAVPAWAVARLLPKPPREAKRRAEPQQVEQRPALPGPLEPLVVPPELSAWRAGSSTRCFVVSIDGGVRLVDWQAGPVEARFATVVDALAAIGADAIRWRSPPRKQLERQSPSARTNPC